MRTIVVGDIHGCYDEFLALLEQVHFSENDLLVSVGDIVDRGAQSLELFQFFKDQKNAITLMGNHERKHLLGVLNYAQEIVKLQFGAAYAEFLTWLEDLPYYYETPEAIIVHAFFEHDKALQEQSEKVLAGTTSGSRHLERKYGTESYWQDHYQGSKPIIYGHHVVGEAVKIYNNTYGIDTGACHGGYLTAIELPGFKVHQLKVQTDHWKQVQQDSQVPVLEAKDWENMRLEQIKQLLEQLSYKKESHVQAFLIKIAEWVQALEQLLETILAQLIAQSEAYQAKFGAEFSRAAAALNYGNFLFMARTNRLNLQELRKSLSSPQKIIALAQDLGIASIPSR